MELMTGALILSLVLMGIFLCAVYFWLRLHPIEHARSFPPKRTNRIPTIISAPSAPEEDCSQYPVTYTTQEFHHLFATDHVNSVDRDHINSNNEQRTPSNNSYNGSNQSDYGFVYPATSRDYGFNHSFNIDYGFIYPTNNGLNRIADAINDPLSNIHEASQYHDCNQSTYHAPMKNIETPPPSYYEAIMGCNPSDYIHQQNRITCGRMKGADGNDSRYSGGASSIGSGDRTGSLSHSEALVGHNHSSNHQLTVHCTCESTKGPSGYSHKRGGGRGDGRNVSGFSGGRSGENRSEHSNGRGNDRNATGIRM